MTTAFFTSDQFHLHTLSGHPEHAGRLKAVHQRLAEYGVLPQLTAIPATPATREELLRAHTAQHLDFLDTTQSLAHGGFIGADTYVFAESYELAKLAAGGAVAVTDAVLRGEAQNGIAAIRPPGHHATPEEAMGFCLINNIAVAARSAIHTHGLERVAIVDFDVHHGNGTQDIFYEDPQVMFMSSHQYPFYPGTGATQETGSGAGKGFTVNVPLPAGVGDESFQQVYETLMFPVLRRYQPQLLLISAGFDAHWADPLASLNISLAGFDRLVRALIALAGELCGGKIVFVMEGGYHLDALSHAWVNVANALLGNPALHDPLGAAPSVKVLPTHMLEGLLRQIKEIHRLG